MTQDELDKMHFTVGFPVRKDRIKCGADQRFANIISRRLLFALEHCIREWCRELFKTYLRK